MRCYYEYVEGLGKVLIPGCMGVAVHNDIRYCTCSPRRETLENRVRKLEIEVTKLQKQIDNELSKRNT